MRDQLAGEFLSCSLIQVGSIALDPIGTRHNHNHPRLAQEGCGTPSAINVDSTYLPDCRMRKPLIRNIHPGISQTRYRPLSDPVESIWLYGKLVSNPAVLPAGKNQTYFMCS